MREAERRVDDQEPKRILVPVVDGRRMQMTNNSGMTLEEAERFVIDKFGADRFGGWA